MWACLGGILALLRTSVLTRHSTAGALELDSLLAGMPAVHTDCSSRYATYGRTCLHPAVEILTYAFLAREIGCSVAC